MIESPSNLTEQILNLTERIAVEIKAILNKLNTAVFKVNGVGPDKEGNISLTSVASATKATQDSAGNNIVNTYLTKTSAANTYATKNELESLTSSKVPVNHASTETTYGSGTSTAYGHVKLSDNTASTLGTAGGTAATPKAVATVYTKATEAYNLASEAKTLAEGALPATGKAVSADSADTALSANTATKATQDAKGNVIDSTYLTKTDASSTYLVKTAKAASATTADTATKATQDSDGKAINTTYVKSVNGQTPVNGNVTVTVPVTSVNGSTGDVTIDVGVTSINGNTGAITPAQTGCLPTSGGTVSGDLTVTGTLKGATIQSTSDIRKKYELEVIKSCLDKVSSITGYTYYLKEDYSGRRAGVIAQDVLKVLPEAVREDSDGFLSLDYNAVISLLVGAIKELREEVEGLKNGK